MTDTIFTQIQRLGFYREDDRWIGGVCSGLAHRFHQDRAVFRAILAASFILTGTGIVLYGALWLLLPDRRTGKSLVERLTTGDFDIAVLGGAALIILGGARGDLFGFSNDWLTASVTITAWLALIVVFVIGIVQRGNHATGSWNARNSYQGSYYPPQGSYAPPEARSSEGPYSPEGAYSPEGPYSPEGAAAQGAPAWSQASTGEAPTNSFAQAPTDSFSADPTWATSAPGAHSPQSEQPFTAPLPHPRAPLPRVKKPGARAFGIATGVLALSLALAVALSGHAILPARTLLIILGSATAIAGGIIIINALRGWSSGSIGLFAILTASAGLVAASAFGFTTYSNGIADEERWVPSSAETSVNYGVGDLTVDLSRLSTTETISARLGVGSMTLLVPADAQVEVEYEVGIGSFTSALPGTHQNRNGFIGDGTITYSGGDSQRTITIDAEVGIGSLTVVPVTTTTHEIGD